MVCNHQTVYTPRERQYEDANNVPKVILLLNGVNSLCGHYGNLQMPDDDRFSREDVSLGPLNPALQADRFPKSTEQSQVFLSFNSRALC